MPIAPSRRIAAVPVSPPSRRERPVLSTASSTPARLRTSCPTMTFSSAVIALKSRMFWNVRAIPAFVTWWGLRPTIGLPSSRISPEVGTSSPVTRLKNVVLPAPLGPMRPWIWPVATVRSTPSRAASPPNRLVSLRTSSRGTLPAPSEPEPERAPGPEMEPGPSGRSIGGLQFHGTAPAGNDALGPVDHDDDQHRSEDEEAVLLKARDDGADDLRHDHDDGGPHDRPPDVAHPTQHDHRQDEDRGPQGEAIRAHEVDPARLDDPRHPRRRCSDGEGPQLHPHRRHPHGGGGKLVLPDRHPCPSDPGVVEPRDHPDHEGAEHQQEVVVGSRVEPEAVVQAEQVQLRMRDGRDPARSHGDGVEVAGGDTHDLAEAERDDGEGVAPQAERRGDP